MQNRYRLLACALLLSGCASVPEELRPTTEQPLLPFTAITQAQKASLARWGGEIADVRNLAEGSEVEVVQFALNTSGRPLKSDRSDGRFLIRVPSFIDPAIYTSGRLVTALGEFSGTEQGAVGNQPYTFPILKARSVHLWPEIKDPPERCSCDPFFNSPFMMRPIIVVPRE